MGQDERDFLAQQIEEIKGLIKQLMEREENRASRINILERDMEIHRIQAEQHQRDNERQFDEAFKAMRLIDTEIDRLKKGPLDAIKTAGGIAGSVLAIMALLGAIVGALIYLHEKGVIK